MGFIEAVKKILELFKSSENIEGDKNVKISFFKNFKLFEIKTEVNNNQKILNVVVDLSKASEEQINQLKPIYQEMIGDKKGGTLLIKKENYKTFEEYKEESKDAPILKFFKGKLKEEDFDALRTSVYIKNKSDSGENIDSLLAQLRRRHGYRGSNICNLYCEGYFDTLIKQFYNLLESKSLQDNFLEEFDDFVTNLPITYFVNQHKTQEVMNEELNSKISRAKKYGVVKINVHGIGSDNKKKIDKFIEEIRERKDISTTILKEEDYRKSIQIVLKEV